MIDRSSVVGVASLTDCERCGSSLPSLDNKERLHVMSDLLFFPSIVRPPLKVHEADAINPPAPPPGAIAVEVRDADGRILSYSWVAPLVDEEIVFARAWDWAETLWPLIAVSMLPSDRPLARGV